MRLHRIIAFAAALCASVSLFATTFIVPTDRELTVESDLVAIGVVTTVESRLSERYGIETRSLIEIERILKGDEPSPVVEIIEAGGFVDGIGLAIAGSARYEPGETVLVFLKRNGSAWTTSGMAMGRFSFESDEYGRQLLVRGNRGHAITGFDRRGEPHLEPVREAKQFLESIEAWSRGEEIAPRYVIQAAAVEPTGVSAMQATAALYMAKTLAGTPNPIRWPTGPTPGGLVSIPVYDNGQSQAGQSDTAGSLSRSLSAWSNAAYSNLRLNHMGVRTGRVGLDRGNIPADYDKNTVVFNATSAQTNGNAGLTVWWFTAATHTYKGHNAPAAETFNNIEVADSFIMDGTRTQTSFDTLVAHELGHLAGFRHSNDEQAPFSSSAIMTFPIPSAYGANLQQWDKEAVNAAYGSQPLPCTPVTITTHPQSQPLQPGQSTVLTVAATGSAPISYQWYDGASGDTTTPISGATSTSYSTPPIFQTKYYWVKVYNSCSNVASNTAALTVAGCTQPSITIEPSDTSIAAGGSATLQVFHGGTSPFTYQWYRGNSGDISQPVAGATQQSFNTGPLSTTSKFWVRISNQCGSTDSRTVTVTVTPQPTAPTIVATSGDKTIQPGQTTTLSVSATGTAPLQYQWYRGTTGDTANPIAGATSPSYTTPQLQQTTKYWVRVTNNQGSASSTTITITVQPLCTPPDTPVIRSFLTAEYGKPFVVSWSANGDVSSWELVESRTTPSGSTVDRTIPTGDTSMSFTLNSADAVRVSYKVRAKSSCDAGFTPFSNAVTIELRTASLPTTPIDVLCGGNAGLDMNAKETDPANTTAGRLLLQNKGTCGGGSGKGTLDNHSATVTATSSSNWLAVTPSTVTVSSGSSQTQSVQVDPNTIPPGTSTGTVTLTTTTSTGQQTTTTVTCSVTVGSPVAPIGKSEPPANAFIIPAVAFSEGQQNSQWRSDIRLANVSTSDIRYRVTFTPSGVNGVQSGLSTDVTVKRNQVVAVDNLLKNWFAQGVINAGSLGMIDVRPVNFTADIGSPTRELATVLSSRTYNQSASGTFGQFIPGVPFSSFVGRTSTGSPQNVLSLQQIAQSNSFRSNFGLTEGSGQPAVVTLKLWDGNGQLVHTTQIPLAPAEHKQLTFGQIFGNRTIENGRVTAEVSGDNGKVYSYASVVDNATNDPFLVLPTNLNGLATDRVVLPGIADLTNANNAWRSDVRLFNASANAVTATLTYYPQSGASTAPADAAVTRNVAIPAGSVVALDNILESTFGMKNGGGSIHVTTATPSAIVATARTYDRKETGTLGQFIPGVVAADTAALNESPLQILQLEESDAYRTNLGLAETTGREVLIEVSALVPNSTVSPKAFVRLRPFEFVQLTRVFPSQLGLGRVFNGRIDVRVVEGSGRVAAYGSVVDNKTGDPTYVPAQ